MYAWLACLCIPALSAGPGPDVEAEHAANVVFRALLDQGVALEGTRVEFPGPILRDGQAPGAQNESFEAVAGSKGRMADLLRDSVSAPFVLKIRDIPTQGGSVVRAADLWFVVHADLDAIDPDAVTPGDSKPVEAGNMRFEGRELAPDELKARRIDPPATAAPGRFPREAYFRSVGTLLDRLHVEATSRVAATRSADSIVVAWQTDPAFRGEGAARNLWRALKGDPDHTRDHDYEGGAGYVKVSRFGPVPGALLVEAHSAFDEPRDWFDGNPILRSKIALVAQDQIRNLRRGLKEPRKD